MPKKNPLIKVVYEIDLMAGERASISNLLQQSFPSYPEGKIYYPQPPHFRMLCFDGDRLIGHLAGILREILIAGNPSLVLGLVDLCIDHEWVGQRLASELIESIELKAKSQGIEFLMAMTADPAFYEKNGFHTIESKCIWLSFLGGKSLGLFKRIPPSGLMVKPISNEPWPEGEIDLLGPLF
jgi:GNAT superfamily N-acetyltransferase